MADALYNKAKEQFQLGTINMTTDTIKAILIDTNNYTVNPVTDQFLSAIPPLGRVATTTLTAGAVTPAGAFDSNNAIFNNVTGAAVQAVVLYKDTGAEATSPLIVYLDSLTGVPFTPNGGDVIVQVDLSGWYSL